MERGTSSDKRDIIMWKAINEGIEAAKQLRSQMLNPMNNRSIDDQTVNHLLMDKMLSSFDTTISIAKSLNFQQPSNNTSEFKFEQPPQSSPRSENSHHLLHVSKKRKTMPRRINKVQVTPGATISGLVGPLDDGLSWRKYGQKDILGSKFPRAYYRCTHRHSRGCHATKQVQVSDEDPSIYLVIYRGEHICQQAAQAIQAQKSLNEDLVKPEPKPELEPKPEPEQLQTQLQEDLYLGLGPDGDVLVAPEGNIRPAHLFRSFSFTSALLDSGPTDNFVFDPSPIFGSGTSESDYLPVGLSVQTSESDFNGPMSGPSSVSNSPMGCDIDFPLDQFLDYELDILPGF